MTKRYRLDLPPSLFGTTPSSHVRRPQMCELWQSQIYDSPSDGVTADVLAAMNRVTLDIVGLAGEAPFDFPPSHILSSCAGCWIGA